MTFDDVLSGVLALAFLLLLCFGIHGCNSHARLNRELVERGVKQYHPVTGELVWSGNKFQPVTTEEQE